MGPQEQPHGQAHAQFQTATERQRVRELEDFLVAASAEHQALVLASEANKAFLTQRVVELEHRVIELQQQLFSTSAPGARAARTCAW